MPTVTSSCVITLLRRGVHRLQPPGQLQGLPHGRRASACGLVTVRQRPQTAKGTIFVTLEDETGPLNVIVWPWGGLLLYSFLFILNAANCERTVP
ncbi:hypothetical protein [Ramlibacter sp. 2FC]|uniref:hypothetical protein n=1 Tax=Ramlibacter sp. 2FC TaxID=2502188 RepID=UPI0010F5B3A0|nr:hypothetical protein [Ramlibacter sp. 2FC]